MPRRAYSFATYYETPRCLIAPLHNLLPEPAPPFPPRGGSLVARVQAGDTDSAAALEEICRNYWYPIYALFRSPEAIQQSIDAGHTRDHRPVVVIDGGRMNWKPRLGGFREVFEVPGFIKNLVFVKAY